MCKSACTIKPRLSLSFFCLFVSFVDHSIIECSLLSLVDLIVQSLFAFLLSPVHPHPFSCVKATGSSQITDIHFLTYSRSLSSTSPSSLSSPQDLESVVFFFVSTSPRRSCVCLRAQSHFLDLASEMRCRLDGRVVALACACRVPCGWLCSLLPDGRVRWCTAKQQSG